VAGQSELASSLDAVLPRFDIRERHSIRVQAPADVVFRLASKIDFEDNRITFEEHGAAKAAGHWD